MICLHVGSSSSAPATSSGAPSDTVGVLFFGWAMFAAVDWLYSKIPVRFPNVKICLSEGGIGWVAGLLDRLDHVGNYQAIFGTWEGVELTPREVDAAQLLVLHHRRPRGPRAAPPHRCRPPAARIGLPASGRHLARHAVDRVVPDRDVPAHEIERMAWRNASELFRHPVPAAVQADPNAF